MRPDRIDEAARELHRLACDLLLKDRLTPAELGEAYVRLLCSNALEFEGWHRNRHRVAQDLANRVAAYYRNLAGSHAGGADDG